MSKADAAFIFGKTHTHHLICPHSQVATPVPRLASGNPRPSPHPRAHQAPPNQKGYIPKYKLRPHVGTQGQTSSPRSNLTGEKVLGPESVK